MNTVTWTDDKIDSLATKVDEGFARMDVEFARTNGRIEKLEAVTDERFKTVDHRLERIEFGFAQMNDKFDALQRTLLQIGGGLIGTVIAAAVALILAHGV